jgi:hypothetical protein
VVRSVHAEQGNGGKVTISASEREAAVIRVLQRLAELCGDERSVSFGTQDIEAARPLRTTIIEMKEQGLIKQVVMLSSPQPYMLTLDGWFEAQQVSARFDSDEFRKRKGRLCATMKAAVDGRDVTALMDWRELAEAANVPRGWLWNLLETQVLYQLDPKGRYRLRFEQGIVWITPTFGL